MARVEATTNATSGAGRTEIGNRNGHGLRLVARRDPRTVQRRPSCPAPAAAIPLGGADHTERGVQFFPTAMAFLDERFAGTPFAGNCADIGPGNSLAPLKIR